MKTPSLLPHSRPPLAQSVTELLKQLSPWPLIGVAIYWGALAVLGGFRSDHALTGFLIVGLYYLGPLTRGQSRRILEFLLPLLLTGIIYDSQRYYSNFIRGRVHVAEPYLFDKRFFGITTASGAVLTPNEYWQLHTSRFLDFLTGFYYLTFIAIFVGIAALFAFYYSKVGSRKMSPFQITWEAPRMMWSFFWLNMIGYTTYYWYAAAPPWYVALYGLGPARMDTPANPGGCIRFDAIFGTHFFTGMYGRSADVFGAIPSLHVAYPLLAIFYSFRFARLRAFSVSFYLIMCFSAVYLNHHYVLDILWGSAYATLTYVAIHWMSERGWILQSRRPILLASTTHRYQGTVN